MKLSKEDGIQNIYKLLSYLPHISLALVIVTTIFLCSCSRIDLLLKASVILVALFLVSIITLLSRHNSPTENLLTITDQKTTGTLYQRLCFIYVIVYVCSVIWILYSQSFDLGVLIFTVILYTITFLHIFLRKEMHDQSIIIELILTSLLFLYSKILTFTYAYSSIDILYHTNIATNIILEGGLLPEEFMGQYAHFPLYHILISASSVIFGTNTYLSAYIVTIPMLVIGTIFIYYISHYFTNSYLISKLAAFFYIMIPVTLGFSENIMAMVPATMGFFCILYVLFQNENRLPIPRYIIVITSLLFLTLVHHVSHILILIVISSILISYWIHSKNITHVQRNILLSIYLIPTSYLLYTFLINLINSISSRLVFSFETGSLTNTVEIGSNVSYLYIFSCTLISALILIFAYLGLYYLITSKYKSLCIIFLPICLISLVIFVPYVIDSFSFLQYTLQITRLRLLLSPFFAIVMGLGCVYLLQILTRAIKSERLVYIVLLILGILVIIGSPILINSSTNSIFSDSDYDSATYFEDSEIHMLQAGQEYIRYGSEIYTDAHAMFYFITTPSMDYYNLPHYITPVGLNLLFQDDGNSTNYSYILLREKCYDDKRLYVKFGVKNGETYIVDPTNETKNILIRNTLKYELFYNNGPNKMYC